MNIAFELPPLQLEHACEINDARAFKDWLKLVPLINVRTAHAEVLEMLIQLNRAFVPPLERLKMLELLREPLQMLQEENSKRYAMKPLPFLPIEAEVWQSNVTLWQEMSLGYQRCWQAGLQGDSAVLDYLALIGQRSLRYTALAIREFHLAYQVVAASLWQKLYQLYGQAEAGGLQSKTVKDSLNRQTELSSCNAAFIQALLLAAANPHGMPLKQILWVDRLLDRWSNQTLLRRELNPHTDEEQAKISLAIDLPMANGVLRRSLDPAPEGQRLLLLGTVMKSLKKRIKLLRAGELPVQIGLGDEFSAAAAETQLIYLYQQWGENGIDRSFQRRASSGEVALVYELAAMHAILEGKPFVSPDDKLEVRGRTIDDFALFGRQAQHLQPAQPSGAPAQLPEPEPWQVIDESALGFRLLREVIAGGRLAHHQLLLLRSPAASSWLLATVRWVSQEDDELIAGVRVLPGMPQAVAVRATGLSPTGSHKYIPALLLPSVAALQSGPSLVLPTGWFKPGRVVETYCDGEPRRMKMTQLLERGADFERISFASGS